MLRKRIRDASTVLMALVLAIGLTMHGFGGSDLMIKSVMTAAGDMPMSSDSPMQTKCDGCAGNEKGLASAACSAFCGAVITLPLQAATLDAVAGETLGPMDRPKAMGRANPPDPYPPRSTILS